MNSKVTIVMYHYVRDLKNSRFPHIKGLELDLFRHQIEYLSLHYKFIRMEELIDAIENKHELPPKAVLLTFDDPYIDHYVNVFPILRQRNIQGSFFPSMQPIIESKLLDTNKIHFILASESNTDELLRVIFSEIKNLERKYGLKNQEYYEQQLHHSKENRYDDKKIVYVKKLLQYELSKECRQIILDDLFRKYVGIKEDVFSKELYMNLDQIKDMKRHGMFVGNHCYSHNWMNLLTYEEQEREISKTAELLLAMGCDKNYTCISYPWGSYNTDTLDIVQKMQIKAGILSKFGIADIKAHGPYLLPRLDTNDIPKDKNAPVNHWYESA